MFKIAVCEDEAAQLAYVKSLILQWQENTGEKAAVDTFSSAEQYLFACEERTGYDLLLLDIQMGQMNGVELARKVRERDTGVSIVFLTGIKEYAIEGYEVGALRYLLKPVKEAELFALLMKLAEEKKAKEEAFFLFQTSAGCTNKVAYSDILYLEADGHYVVLKAAREWKWKENFSDVSARLDGNGFFLLRRGLLVNLAKVEQIGKTECILENGEVLPVTKGRYQELNEKFIAYYKGMKE